MIRTFDEYQKMAAYTAVYPHQGDLLGLLYNALSLGEIGEFQGKISKILRDNGGVITEELVAAAAKELGDAMWHISAAATELGLKLEDIADGNIRKLLDRKSRGVLHGSGDDR